MTTDVGKHIGVPFLTGVHQNTFTQHPNTYTYIQHAPIDTHIMISLDKNTFETPK